MTIYQTVANIKGPQGVGLPGPRGLPGVNAVPADEAVAEYLLAEDSESGLAMATFASRNAAAGLRASLAAGVSTGIAVVGDSTGNDTYEWPYLIAQAVAAAHPEYTVRTLLWSDAAQDQPVSFVLQTGSGGVEYLDCNSGIATRALTTAESAHTAGVIDVRARVRMDDWTMAAPAIPIAREGGAGKRAWYFGVVGASGKLGFYYSTDGTTLITDRISTVAPTVADGDTIWIRAVFTPSATIRYYTSIDGFTWTQLGAGVLINDTPALGTVFNAATPYELGGRQGGISYTGMRIYAVDVRDGENGKPIVPILPSLWGATATNAAIIAGAPTFSLVNGSHPGADIAYWTQARLEKALPAYGQRLVFVSLSHNELQHSGPSFVGRYATFLALVKARGPAIPMVCLTQNPEKSPRAAGFITAQATRRVDITTTAASAGAVTVDTYPALAANLVANVEPADGVHPTIAGQLVWRDTVLAALGL